MATTASPDDPLDPANPTAHAADTRARREVSSPTRWPSLGTPGVDPHLAYALAHTRKADLLAVGLVSTAVQLNLATVTGCLASLNQDTWAASQTLDVPALSLAGHLEVAHEACRRYLDRHDPYRATRNTGEVNSLSRVARADMRAVGIVQVANDDIAFALAELERERHATDDTSPSTPSAPAPSGADPSRRVVQR